MRVYAATNIACAKSFPSETKIPPGCHVLNIWIAASNTNHYLILKYTYRKFGQLIISNLCYKNICILQFLRKTSFGRKIIFMIF